MQRYVINVSVNETYAQVQNLCSGIQCERWKRLMAVNRTEAINSIIKKEGVTGNQAEERKKQLTQMSDTALSAFLSGAENVQNTDLGTDALLTVFSGAQNAPDTGSTTSGSEIPYPAIFGCGFSPISSSKGGSNSKSDTPEKLANTIFELQKKGGFSTNSIDFQTILNQKINENNIVEVMTAYEKISGQSLIKLIVGRVNDGTSKQREESGMTLFNYLCQKAFSAKMKQADIDYFTREFQKELKKQSLNISQGSKDSLNKGISELESTMGAIVFSMKNLNKASKISPNDTTGILESKEKSAQDSFLNENNGWSGTVANYARGVLGWDNTKINVQKDLVDYKFSMQRLETAQKLGLTNYADEFRKIFGISYNPANVEAYQEKATQYQLSMLCDWIETNYKKSVSELLKPPKLPLTEEGKKTVYNKDFSNFAKFLGQGNQNEGEKQLLVKLIEKDKNFDKLSFEGKYNILHNLAIEYGKNLTDNTKAATRGKSVEQVRKEYDILYKAAFGETNDIVKRVNDYNLAQQTGSMIVKTSVKLGGTILAGALTGGTGLAVLQALLATGAAAAAIDVGVELSDNPKADILEVLKSAGINGATVVGSGFGSIGIKILGQMYKISPLLEGAAQIAGDILVGMGSELAQSGTVTIEGTVFAVGLSAAGQLVSLKKIGQIKEGINAGSEIESARAMLGIPENAQLTADVIEKALALKIKDIKPDADGNVKVSNELKIAKAQLEAAAEITQSRSEAAAADEGTKKTQQSVNPASKSKFENIVDDLLNKLDDASVDKIVNELISKLDDSSASKINDSSVNRKLLKKELMEFCVDDESLGEVVVNKFLDKFELKASPIVFNDHTGNAVCFSHYTGELILGGSFADDQFRGSLDYVKLKQNIQNCENLTDEAQVKTKIVQFKQEVVMSAEEARDYSQHTIRYKTLSPQSKKILCIVHELKHAEQFCEIAGCMGMDEYTAFLAKSFGDPEFGFDPVTTEFYEQNIVGMNKNRGKMLFDAIKGGLKRPQDDFRGYWNNPIEVEARAEEKKLMEDPFFKLLEEVFQKMN